MCSGALSLVSGAVGAASNFQHGKAQAALLKHQAQAQKRNARIARDRGALHVAAKDRERKALVGQAIAGAKAGGLEASGSVAHTIKDLIERKETEKAALIHSAQSERSGHLIAADRSKAQARIVTSKGRTAAMQSAIGGLKGFT